MRLGLFALALVFSAPASAQAPRRPTAPTPSIGLPLTVHVERGERGPVVHDAYVDYAVEIANRWLRPAGVCAYVASRRSLEAGGFTRASFPRSGARGHDRAYARAIPVLFGTGVVDHDGDTLSGWARSGAYEQAVVDVDRAQVNTLAHELGHIVGLGHVEDERDVMHASAPRLDEPTTPMSPAARARAFERAQRVAARVGSAPARCMTPRPLPAPSAIASGSPILHRVDTARYTGEMLFGIRHGRGAVRYDGGSGYVGTFAMHRPNGRGRYTYPNGAVFEGDFVDGLRHGHGTTRWANGAWYRGEYRRDARTGRGLHRHSNGEIYEGDVVNGQRHGRGRLHFASGGQYEGDFSRGVRHGRGTLRYASGGVYVGSFQHGERHGVGRMHYRNGAIYVGSFHRDRRHGQGELRYPRGSVYRGEFAANERHGHGQLVLPSGDVYVGAWRDDEPHGRGRWSRARRRG